MHRIRLREPWTANLNAELGAIVYARKFHKPTGVHEQPIFLQVVLLPHVLEEPDIMLAILVNGLALSPQIQATENESHEALRFELKDLQAFNSLELRISGATGKTGPSGPIFGATAIPTFGSFVIESVELAID